MKPLIKHRVGNGERTFLWFDNWHPMGPLLDHFGERIIYDSALKRDSKVAVIVKDEEWKWPSARTIQLMELQQSTPAGIHPSYDEDRVI